jgi:hypothetical protein
LHQVQIVFKRLVVLDQPDHLEKSQNSQKPVETRKPGQSQQLGGIGLVPSSC